jgi:hypothetical protein
LEKDMDLTDDINTDHGRIRAQIGRLEAVRDEIPRREGLTALVILIATHVRAEEAVFYSALKTLTPELSNKLVAEHQVISSGALEICLSSQPLRLCGWPSSRS